MRSKCEETLLDAIISCSSNFGRRIGALLASEPINPNSSSSWSKIHRRTCGRARVDVLLKQTVLKHEIRFRIVSTYVWAAIGVELESIAAMVCDRLSATALSVCILCSSDELPTDPSLDVEFDCMVASRDGK